MIRTVRQFTLVGTGAALALALTACGGSSTSSSSSSSTAAGGASSSASAGASASAPAGGGAKIPVFLITKDSTNPFFVAMQSGAKQAATASGVVDLTVGSAKAEGDDAGQISLIEQAIASNAKGILITPMSSGVNAAMTKAREAGIYVIALDTPPDPANTVDITFATDNRQAGKLIGQYTAAKLSGQKATIALLDLFDNKVVSVDYDRDQGFLEGLGVPVGDPKKNGDEAKTGKYTGGKGGEYQIVGNEATNGNAKDGQAAMERLIAKNPNINVVYSINEPAGEGAAAALKAAGKNVGKDVFIVSVDGGKAGIKDVQEGIIAATSQQYPLLMADLGVKAIVDVVQNNKKPQVSPGLDFYNTGVNLIAKDPLPGVESKDTTYGLDNAWG